MLAMKLPARSLGPSSWPRLRPGLPCFGSRFRRTERCVGRIARAVPRATLYLTCCRMTIRAAVQHAPTNRPSTRCWLTPARWKRQRFTPSATITQDDDQGGGPARADEQTQHQVLADARAMEAPAVHSQRHDHGQHEQDRRQHPPGQRQQVHSTLPHAWPTMRRPAYIIAHGARAGLDRGQPSVVDGPGARCPGFRPLRTRRNRAGARSASAEVVRPGAVPAHRVR